MEDEEMEMYNDILSALYLIASDQRAKFKYDDGSLNPLHSESSLAFDKITKFINTKVASYHRNELLKLLKEHNLKQLTYFDKEGEMFYKEGFSDAVNLLFRTVSVK